MTWTPSRDLEPPENRPDSAWVRTFGPVVAKSYDFPGCSNWSGPSHTCTCETWNRTDCSRCDEPVCDGDVISGKYGADLWGDGEYVEWSETWHDKCPAGPQEVRSA